MNDLSIIYFSYKVMWDKGSRLDILIGDPNAQLQAALESMVGSPTPTITFELEWTPSKDRSYHNKGTKHQLHILKVGMVTVPDGLAIRIRAVDMASIMLREKTLSHYAGGVKASNFIEDLCKQCGVDCYMPETGDVAYTHQALQARPIDHIRYELDRVLSANGKPISMQFDDSQQQILKGFEELYDLPTEVLDTLSGGRYSYGGLAPTQGVVPGFGTAAYHFEMDQDFRPAIWGHQVSVNHLTNNGQQITGNVLAKLANKLGVQGDVFKDSTTRLHLPAGHIDNPTSEEYFAKAIMTNTVFQSEMCATQGSALVNVDFRAFDGIDLLNRKHLEIGITGGDLRKTGNAIIPIKSVVMGYEHRLNKDSAFTKVFLRRGI